MVIAGAEKSFFLQHKIGWSSYTTSKYIVSNNLIRNSGITFNNIEKEFYIYGTQTVFLKGKE